MATKRPANNNVTIHLKDAEIDALLAQAEQHDEKTTTQARTYLLFGLEMAPVIDMARQRLAEENSFQANGTTVTPNITDGECLRWIQHAAIDTLNNTNTDKTDTRRQKPQQRDRQRPTSSNPPRTGTGQ